jgi:hypothetical protein
MYAFLKSASMLLSAGLVGLATGAALYQAAQPQTGLMAIETPADGVPVTRLAPLAAKPVPAASAPMAASEPRLTTFSASVAKPIDRSAISSDGRSPKASRHVQAKEKRKVPRHARAHGKHHPA